MAPKSVSVDAKWTNRTYQIAASTPQELAKWMQVLDEAGKRAAAKAKSGNKDAPDTIQNEVEQGKPEKNAEEESEEN